MSEMGYLSFAKGSDAGRVFREWWDGLQDNHGDRAVLRRCRTPYEVALIPAYYRLRFSMKGLGCVNDEALAVVAGLASHVREDTDFADFPSQMASSKPGGNARISGLRFRRLLKIEDRDELYATLIRTIRLLDGAVNLSSLADSAYWWNEKTRKRWAMAYYESALPSEK